MMPRMDGKQTAYFIATCMTIGLIYAYAQFAVPHILSILANIH